MSNVSIEGCPPLTRLLAEARSATRIQQNIVQSLELLLKLSAVQLELKDDQDWVEVLRRKQLLIRDIEEIELGLQINRARQIAEQLIEQNEWEVAERLREMNRVIRERLILLAEREHLAQERLEQQVSKLRGALCVKQQHRQVQGAYGGSSSVVPSRFVDRLR